jgi:lipoprotein-anchoring transpeptidase ErfK/SrfK
VGSVDVSIHIDRSRRRLTVRRAGRVVRRLPIAVGRPGTPTPLGRFAVTDRLHTGRDDSPYGCCALALTGHQTKLLPGWPGGDRLAIHATPQPETIGTAASLGCMRASERDLRALFKTVPPGAPVFIRA